MLKDPVILRIARRVNYRLHPKPTTTDGTANAIVEVKHIDGKQYLKEVQFAYGHPRNPLSIDDLIAKFRDCARYSAKPMTRGKIDRVIDLVNRLEDVADVSQVIQLLG